MSNQQAPDQQASKYDDDRIAIIDPVLESLVRLANRGVGMSITLLIGGFVVTGELRGVHLYHAALARAVREMEVDDPHQAVLAPIAATFQRMAELQADELTAWLQADDAAQPAAQDPWHVHLEHATLVHPSGNVIRVGWWRGRLANIDGFSLERCSLTEM